MSRKAATQWQPLAPFIASLGISSAAADQMRVVAQCALTDYLPAQIFSRRHTCCKGVQARAAGTAHTALGILLSVWLLPCMTRTSPICLAGTQPHTVVLSSPTVHPMCWVSITLMHA